MSSAYVCESCDTKVVLVNSGGVFRTIICRNCGDEMDYDESVETEAAPIDSHNTWQLVE